jgi:hemerythrin superfamily protein
MIQKLVLQSIMAVLQSKFIENILHDEFQKFVQDLKNRLVQVIDIVTDNNPEDREQFAALWKDIKENAIQSNLLECIATINNTVQDEVIKTACIAMLKQYISENEINNNYSFGLKNQQNIVQKCQNTSCNHQK